MSPDAAEPSALVIPAPPELRTSPRQLLVRARADSTAPLLGVIDRDSPFVVFGTLTGPGCTSWGLVAAGGVACLDRTTITTEPPRPHPLIGELPFVYGRRAAPVYASLAAYEAGARPRRLLEDEVTYHFLEVVPSARGDVAVRQDGSVVPVSKLSVYEPSTFAGHDLLAAPLPEGASLAWCASTGGCGDVAYHGEILLLPGATAPKGRMRTWRPAVRPEGVGEAEVWVDIDVDQQILALMRGDTAELVTLVSTGLPGEFETPKGARRVTDKQLAGDMESLPEAPEAYHVDQVPWVAHFRPRYALHAAFWHDRFGNRRSHGCVNLAPADARRVFAAIEPALPTGWFAIYGRGTLIVIH